MEYWAHYKGDLKTIESVEAHSYPHVVSDAWKITKEEYDDFIASLPIVKPKPSELEKLKARVEALEKK